MGEEFDKPYFASLVDFVRREYSSTVCYPPGHEIFNAFNLCPFDKVKVVIIGQDPYHEPGQAEGLCFSVKEGVMPPPSLVNIFKEIQGDLGRPIPANGSLRRWAEQGVLHKIPAVNGYILCSHVQHECNSHCHSDAHSHNSSFILVCTQCGTVDEQSLNREWQALHQAVEQTGFALNEEHVVLTGVCGKCRA